MTDWIFTCDALPPDPNPEKAFGSATHNVCVRQGNGLKTMTMDWEKAPVRGKAKLRWCWHGRLSSWEVICWAPLPKPPEGYVFPDKK